MTRPLVPPAIFPSHSPTRSLAMTMFFRLLLCMVLGCLLAACASPKKKQAANDHAKQDAQTAAMADLVNNDPDFEAFIQRLRAAVAGHDMDTLASMMTPNFGYRLNPDAEGDGVFQYWDDELLWPQLAAVVNQKWVPKGDFMVSPPEFVTDPNFHGYRAGITMAQGSWKFAYFVTD
jgi:hypothetical protein